MKKVVAIILLVVVVTGIVIARLTLEQEAESRKRIREDQIIAYRDSSTVEFSYSQPKDERPVYIQVEVMAGDGGCPITGLIKVDPGETVSIGDTFNKKPYNSFAVGIYGGRILVFDEDMKLTKRVEPLECRIYESVNSSYDSVKLYDTPIVSFQPAASEDHSQHRILRINLNRYEIYTALPSLSTQDRNINIEIFSIIEGQEWLIARANNVEPNSICNLFYTDREVTDMMSGQEYSARVKYSYCDSGEQYAEETAEFVILE